MKGLGTDIIEIERIKNAYIRYGKKFLDRIYTPREQLYCLSHKNPAEHLAVRFAAKEAVAKAMGTGFQKGLSFLDIEIINNQDGKPEVVLSNQCSYFNSPILISLSHCKEYALALACIEN